MIKFRCQHCSKKIGVQDDYAGKRVWCPKCHQPAQVPDEPGNQDELNAAKERTQYSVFVCRRALDGEEEEEFSERSFFS